MTTGEREPRQEAGLEEIRELLDNRLRKDRAEAIRDMLVDDPELARAALDATDLERLAAVAEVSSEDVERAWSRFASRLDDPSEPRTVAAPRRFGPSLLQRFLGVRPRWALAASFLAGVGLSVLLLSVSESLRDGAAEVLVERLESHGGGPPRGGGEVLEVGGEVDMLVLLLAPPSSLALEVPTQVSYSVSREAVRIKSGRLLQQDEGVFALLLPTDSIVPGDYWIELSRPAETKPFATYGFEVAAREDR